MRLATGLLVAFFAVLGSGNACADGTPTLVIERSDSQLEEAAALAVRACAEPINRRSSTHIKVIDRLLPGSPYLLRFIDNQGVELMVRRGTGDSCGTARYLADYVDAMSAMDEADRARLSMASQGVGR